MHSLQLQPTDLPHHVPAICSQVCATLPENFIGKTPTICYDLLVFWSFYRFSKDLLADRVGLFSIRVPEW